MRISTLISLTLAAAFVAGCVGMDAEERQAFGVLGALMNISPESTPQEAALGALIYQESLRADKTWGRKYTVTCTRCNGRFHFQGQHTRVACPHCRNVCTFSYGH